MTAELCNSTQCPVGTTVVLNGPGALCGVTLTPAAAISTITVYDNASVASGSIILNMSAPANAASIFFSLGNIDIAANNGLTVVVTGTAATANVAYRRI